MTTTRRQSVVIADDHATTRALIRFSLEEHEFEVVGEVSSGPDAVALTLEHEPDVCLLDLHMPGGDGLEAVVQITARLPRTRCIILTVSEDAGDLIAALAAGASGFVCKSSSLADIGDILARASDEETILPRRMTLALGRRLSDTRHSGAAAGRI